MKKFNPKITEFMKENPDLTVMGLVWAGWWRIYLAILGVSFGLGLFLSFFEN